ncbi:transient receptor potential cation channel subfamily V member 6-like [Erpetoichthys calabaricus]|uniref:transient receptor potential cation channel subfamily V member 6-like n=1 Tax=Erpetoichthys calabaricus TaxID=27687 RepID=UPI0010A017F0|nr:transient receptor potential cation channel subfamily V member 6-like [Erpetoichthys calabaricus]
MQPNNSEQSSQIAKNTSTPFVLRAKGLIVNWWKDLVFRYLHKKDWKQVVDEAHLQQIQRTTENLLLLAAKKNDVATIKKMSKQSDTDFFERGALGETALHVATLYDNLEAAVALLDAAPDLVNQVITSDLYAGKTALHIAAANQNLNLVKELIRRGADVIKPRVTGSYFSKNRKNLIFYGEHILSYAASTGNEIIVKLLLDNGADIRAQDSWGNTVLHILVLQPNAVKSCHMFDLILAADKNINGQIPLDRIKNKKGLTPFRLATAVGNLKMFQHIVNKRYLVHGHCGTKSYLYDISEIDSFENESSILELIVSSQERKAFRILEMTPVKQLIYLKWNKYGRYYFCILMLFYLLYITLFTLCCVFRPLKHYNSTNHQDVTIYVKKTLKESYITHNDYLRLGGEVISVFGAIVILLLEVPSILKVGVTRYFGYNVLGGPFHATIISYAVLVLVLLILRLTSSKGETEVMALALVLCWGNNLYFARGFEILGPSVIVLQKVIFSDLLKFLWLLVFTLIGFSTALWMAYMTQNPSADVYFADFATVFLFEYKMSLGLLNIPINTTVWTPSIVKVLHTALTVFALLLLMSLLSAMQRNTFARVRKEKDDLWRAQIVATTIMLERRLPRCMWPRLGIWGQDYGLGNKWFLRIEEKQENTA